MIICANCKEEKDIIDYYIAKGRHMSICKECHKKKATERTHASREKSDRVQIDTRC